MSGGNITVAKERVMQTEGLVECILVDFEKDLVGVLTGLSRLEGVALMFGMQQVLSEYLKIANCQEKKRNMLC